MMEEYPGCLNVMGSVLLYTPCARRLAPMPLLLCLALLTALAGCASGGDVSRTFPRTITPLPGPSSVSPYPSAQPVNPAMLITDSTDHQKVGQPYVVGGRTYVPQRDDSYDRVGIASWYGPTFHGRATANGETFNEGAMTAAHTTLPIPSIVEVTNLENGRQVLVRVNDRGPFVDDRLIDLSRAAADQLGYRANGLARVRVRYLGPALPSAAAPEPGYLLADVGNYVATPALEDVARNGDASLPGVQGGMTIQAGAFADLTNANRLAGRISEAGDVWVQAGESNGQTIYRVYLGRWPDRSSADAARVRLTHYGIRDARIIDLN
jgi:rare lipoprotein A